jgi:hypothetical protein
MELVPDPKLSHLCNRCPGIAKQVCPYSQQKAIKDISIIVTLANKKNLVDRNTKTNDKSPNLQKFIEWGIAIVIDTFYCIADVRAEMIAKYIAIG